MPAVISKPRPSSRTLPSMRPESPQNIKSSPSGARPAPMVVGGCGGPKPIAGPSGWQPTCTTQANASAQQQHRPDAAGAPLYEAPHVDTSPTSSPSKPKPQRVSTFTLHRHLSIASSTSVLPFSNKRRPSIPLEDFPTSPTDDEWEDFSFEEDLVPVSPTRRTVRRRPSAPLSPRLTKGASLSRSHASRRSRKSRMNSRGPASPITNSDPNRPLSVYSAYSYYDPAQIDDSASRMSFSTDSFTEIDNVSELGEVPGGKNLEPRGSVSSITTVRPSADQRKDSRLGGFKDKFRWLPGRGGQGHVNAHDSSSDESLREPENAGPAGTAGNRPIYNRAQTTSQVLKKRPVVFTRPGFRSLSKSSVSSTDFQPSHGYKSSTDSSSYAPSFSSFEQNLRIGGQSGSYSSCGDEYLDDSPRSKPRPLSPSRASSIILPNESGHARNRSDNYEHLRPRSAISTELMRLPTIRMKNGIPHHSADPEHVPYPLSYSTNMMEADRWNHALLFGDDRNPGNAGGLLRTSNVSFSQFYGVGSGKKEVLKGRELRGGKVLDLGCGEGLWVLAAAKEWKHTCFVGFDLLPVQMNLYERLEGARNAQDIIDRIEWVQGDFLQKKLPFADNSFDLVRLANTTLALPTDPHADNCRLRTLFSEIFRILKVDGELEIIDENHTVPSSSKASPSHPENRAFHPYVGPQMRQLEQAFGNMLSYHKLSAYDAIPKLLEQHFSTASEKAKFKLAISPDENAVANVQRRNGASEQIVARAELDHELGLLEEPLDRPAHGRSGSFSSTAPRSRNHKMLQILGKEYAEARKPVVPQGLIVLPNKMLPMSPAAVFAHATHSTNVLLGAKEQLFDYIELCAQGRATVDRQELQDLVWEYEMSRFDRIGLRDPLHSGKGWETGISDLHEGLYSFEQRSPKLPCASPPPDTARMACMGPLPAWRYESEQDVITVREIRVCLARKLSAQPPQFPRA